MGCAASANDDVATTSVQQRSHRHHLPTYIEEVLALHQHTANVAGRSVDALEGLEECERAQLRNIAARRAVSRIYASAQRALGSVPDPLHPNHLDWYNHRTQDDSDEAAAMESNETLRAQNEETMMALFEQPQEDAAAADTLKSCAANALMGVSQVGTPASFSESSGVSVSFDVSCTSLSRSACSSSVQAKDANYRVLITPVAPNPLGTNGDEPIAHNAPTVLKMPTFGASPELALAPPQPPELNHQGIQLQTDVCGGKGDHLLCNQLEISARSILRASTSSRNRESVSCAMMSTSREDLNSSKVSRRSVKFCLDMVEESAAA